MTKLMTDNPPANGKLRLFFRGLCVFYVDPGTEHTTSPNYITALFPDARVPESLYPYKDEKSSYTIKDPLFPHIPLLSIPKDLFPKKSLEIQEKAHKFMNGDEFVFPLNNHEIAVYPDVKAEFIYKTKDFDNLIPCLRDYALYQDVRGHYIPIPMDETLLKVTAGSPNKKLSALLNITQGLVGVPSSQNPDPRRGADYIKTVFDDDDNSDNSEAQTFSNCVCWDIDIMPVERDTSYYYPVEIKLNNFNPCLALTLKLELKPIINKEGYVTGAMPGNISIINMPPEGTSMFLDFQKQRDLDFALTYSVLKYPPLYPKLPRKVFDENDADQTVPPLMCGIARY